MIVPFVLGLAGAYLGRKYLFKEPRPVTTTPVKIPSGPPAQKGVTYRVRDVQRLDAAAALGRILARELYAKGKRSSRKLIRQFQKTAGLKIDGKYGPKTAGALFFYTKKKIRPFPRYGRGFVPYAPPF